MSTKKRGKVHFKAKKPKRRHYPLYKGMADDLFTTALHNQ
jgi:hypothetical protein